MSQSNAPRLPDGPKSLPPLRWVRPPQQERSQRTLERILDAAEAWIVENGVQSLTVSGVVARAQSSVGAFYARFPDKTALLTTLHERESEAALATTEVALDPARWAHVPLAEALSSIVSFVVHLFNERQRLVLAFVSVAASQETIARRRARLMGQVAERLHAFLDARGDEVPHPDLRFASEVVVRIIFGTLESDSSARVALPDAEHLDEARLGAELTRALLGYLGIPVSTRILRPRDPFIPGASP
jgi:AcrR family transcriptional regulator